MKLPTPHSLYESIWLDHRECHGCRYHYTEHESGFLKDHICTASPHECPEIHEALEEAIADSFDPDEELWFGYYGTHDPEGLSVLAFSREFKVSLEEAYTRITLWQALQSIKRSLA